MHNSIGNGSRLLFTLLSISCLPDTLLYFFLISVSSDLRGLRLFNLIGRLKLFKLGTLELLKKRLAACLLKHFNFLLHKPLSSLFLFF